MRFFFLSILFTLASVAQAQEDLPGHDHQLVIFVSEELDIEPSVAYQLLDSSLNPLLREMHLTHMMAVGHDIDTVALLAHAAHHRAVELMIIAKEHKRLLDTHAADGGPEHQRAVTELSNYFRGLMAQRQGWVRSSVSHIEGKTSCLPYNSCSQLYSKLLSLEQDTHSVMLTSYQLYSEWLSFRR